MCGEQYPARMRCALHCVFAEVIRKRKDQEDLYECVNDNSQFYCTVFTDYRPICDQASYMYEDLSAA